MSLKIYYYCADVIENCNSCVDVTDNFSQNVDNSFVNTYKFS